MGDIIKYIKQLCEFVYKHLQELSGVSQTAKDARKCSEATTRFLNNRKHQILEDTGDRHTNDLKAELVSKVIFTRYSPQSARSKVVHDSAALPLQLDDLKNAMEKLSNASEKMVQSLEEAQRYAETPTSPFVSGPTHAIGPQVEARYWKGQTKEAVGEVDTTRGRLSDML